MKIFIITLCIILFNSFACQADSDNDIKYWLGNKKITVAKRIIGDKTEKIDVSKITDMSIAGKEISLNPMHSITTLLIKFKYSYKETIIPCTAAITYTWATAKGPLAPKNLENIIVYSEL